MKNMNKEKLILVKKLIGLGSAVLCLLLMLIKFIKYTSTSTLVSGGSLTWESNISLYSFLFNKDFEAFDGTISVLREAFEYSHVVMWISFILCLVSVAILTAGVFMKKGLLSKIGSFVLMGAIVILATLIFDRETSANTVRYLNVFTIGYLLLIVTSGLGLMATVTIKE
jgi:hypothetical protein